MNRDLVFFVAGLCFGVAAGYFVFQAVTASGSTTTASSAAAAASPGRSQIGLDDVDQGPQAAPLDQASVDRLEASAKDDPSDAAVRAELGKLYLDAGQYEDAGAWLRAALEIEPGDVKVRTQLALSLLNMGRLDEAVAAYEENLRVEPAHPASLLGLGRVKLYLQQDIDGGLALWQRLIEVAPSSAEAASVRDELEALKSAHPGG